MFVGTAIAGAAIASQSTALPALAQENPDAEIIRLSDRILELRDQADVIDEESIWPFEPRCVEIAEAGRYTTGRAEHQAIWDEICKHRRDTGMEAAAEEQGVLFDEADVLIKKLWSIPAKTEEGRQAKVWALFRHVMPADWFESDRDAEWEIQMARKLLLEFAGMDVSDLIAA